MNDKVTELNPVVCKKARISRDSRFDGCFFTAVKTTGIYCRNICPATPPKESNVIYFKTAIEAAEAGFRPCLRCRPDSAPSSAAWVGSQAVLNRAIRLLEPSVSSHYKLSEISQYLGISDRYLRLLFKKHLGTSPKKYMLYQQCMFAKQMIHQTQLPLSEIAQASGFKSVRRFNDCFVKLMKLTPSKIRGQSLTTNHPMLSLKLNFRPPYDWNGMQSFLADRALKNIETVSANSYGRSFIYRNIKGSFVAKYQPNENAFQIDIKIAEIKHLRPIINNIRRILDVDANTVDIESHLKALMPAGFNIKEGLRLPGIWDLFEAGIRAVLGQQVSIQAAKKLLHELVVHLGVVENGVHYFPTPQAIATDNLNFLKMPNSRKNSLRALANYCIENTEANNPESWLAIKGIGPWTVNYSKMRGYSHPDVFLTGDSGIKNALAKSGVENFNPETASPWRSYLTLQLWRQ